MTNHPTPATLTARSRQLIAGVLAMLVCAATLVVSPAAGAETTYADVTVTNSGNLTIVVNEANVGLRVLSNGLFEDVFSVTVYDRDPNEGNAQPIEVHNVSGVTNNVLITATDGSLIRIGASSSQTMLPADLRVEERTGTEGWSLGINDATIGDDLRVFAAGQVSVWLDGVTVVDDTLIDGHHQIRGAVTDSTFQDRLRVAARDAGSLMGLEFDGVTGGDTLIIGAEKSDDFVADDSVFDRLRFRLRQGNDDLTLRSVDVGLGLIASVGRGNDDFVVDGLEGLYVRVTGGAGDDEFIIDRFELQNPTASVVSGGADDDLLIEIEVVPGMAVRSFERIDDGY